MSTNRCSTSAPTRSRFWATPLLNTIQMRVELLKHDAKENALAYFGSRPNGKLEVPTYNNTTPYIFGN